MPPADRRLLLTGSNGQIGWELRRTLAPLGQVTALSRQELDLVNPDRIVECISELRPTIIVNAAAYTAVDRAEQEPDLAHAVNAIAPGVLAEQAKRIGALLVHYSTDYVFDGTKASPYTEQDAPRPLGVYGSTKLAGERAVQAAGAAHVILRTSWVYATRGKNFLLTIQRLARERSELRVVNDQIGAPTWSRFIAEATALMLVQPQAAEHSGLYHLSAAGQTSWYGFAAAIVQVLAEQAGPQQARPKLVPIPSHEYPSLVQRPQYSVLDNRLFRETFGLYSPGWEEQLALAL
jgi:dTDP-4-dehydrorhamnose reductase